MLTILAVLIALLNISTAEAQETTSVTDTTSNPFAIFTEDQEKPLYIAPNYKRSKVDFAAAAQELEKIGVKPGFSSLTGLYEYAWISYPAPPPPRDLLDAPMHPAKVVLVNVKERKIIEKNDFESVRPVFERFVKRIKAASDDEKQDLTNEMARFASIVALGTRQCVEDNFRGAEKPTLSEENGVTYLDYYVDHGGGVMINLAHYALIMDESTISFVKESGEFYWNHLQYSELQSFKAGDYTEKDFLKVEKYNDWYLVQLNPETPIPNYEDLPHDRVDHHPREVFLFKNSKVERGQFDEASDLIYELAKTAISKRDPNARNSYINALTRVISSIQYGQDRFYNETSYTDVLDLKQPTLTRDGDSIVLNFEAYDRGKVQFIHTTAKIGPKSVQISSGKPYDPTIFIQETTRWNSLAMPADSSIVFLYLSDFIKKQTGSNITVRSLDYFSEYYAVGIASPKAPYNATPGEHWPYQAFIFNMKTKKRVAQGDFEAIRPLLAKISSRYLAETNKESGSALQFIADFTRLISIVALGRSESVAYSFSYKPHTRDASIKMVDGAVIYDGFIQDHYALGSYRNGTNTGIEYKFLGLKMTKNAITCEVGKPLNPAK